MLHLFSAADFKSVMRDVTSLTRTAEERINPKSTSTNVAKSTATFIQSASKIRTEHADSALKFSAWKHSQPYEHTPRI